MKMEIEISLLSLLAPRVTGMEKLECCWKGLWSWARKRCSRTNAVCNRSWKSAKWVEEALTVNAEANSPQSHTLFMVDWGMNSPSQEPPIPLNQFHTFSSCTHCRKETANIEKWCNGYGCGTLCCGRGGKRFMLEKPNGGAKMKLRKGENFTAKHNLIKYLFFLFKSCMRGSADANYWIHMRRPSRR